MKTETKSYQTIREKNEMIVADLNVGDRFAKWDGVVCRLLDKGVGTARIKIETFRRGEVKMLNGEEIVRRFEDIDPVRTVSLACEILKLVPDTTPEYAGTEQEDEMSEGTLEALKEAREGQAKKKTATKKAAAKPSAEAKETEMKSSTKKKPVKKTTAKVSGKRNGTVITDALVDKVRSYLKEKGASYATEIASGVKSTPNRVWRIVSDGSEFKREGRRWNLK